MAELGTVVALIKSMSGADPAVIEEAVADWMAAHPEATTTVQDGSITEAKLAQDVLADLAEIDTLSEALTTFTGNKNYGFTEDKYIATNGTSVNIASPDSASGYRYATADCSEGDVFIISGRGSIVAGLWAFAKANGEIITKSDSTSQVENLEIVAPVNAAILVVNSNRTPVLCQKGDALVNRVAALETTQGRVDEYIDGIKVFDQTGNLFEAKTGFIEGQYYYRSGSNLVTGTNSEFNGFIVPVAKNTHYTCTTSNIVLLDETKKPLTTGADWDFEAVTSCNSGDASFFAVTYRLSYMPTEGYAMSNGYVLDYNDYAETFYAKSLPSDAKSVVKTVSGAIASGGNLTISGKSAVKDGQQIILNGKFSSFNELKIEFSSTGSTNYVSVTSANLVVSNNTNSTITEAHGLTIANEITLLLELKQSNMYISVTSGGVTFKYNCFWNQTGGLPVETVAKAVSMAFTEAKLSVVYSSAKRDVWYFGDSYAQFGTDTRIPYYMVEYGFDKNVMFNAVSGGTSWGGYQSFGTLLTYGTPKFAVFALGMNNGDTDSSTPNASWLEKVQDFIGDCKSNGITPVLCTIPTVPSVNNEAKNAWVRASGERYVDYASAVGADSSGTWYTGMLSTDNVHPSTLGGNTLFMQLISDLPEVMN